MLDAAIRGGWIFMETTLIIAGIAQIALALASLAIPRVLGWRHETERLGALAREVFWTYAAYIWAANVAFGLLAALAPHWLLGGTGLARAVCGFTALWWGARLVIQFTSFGRHAPVGRRFRVAEAVLVGLFLGLTVVYTLAMVPR